MSALKICRICLCKHVKVYNYDQYDLKQYYEEILAKEVNYQDGLPHYFCYVCATMLYKFHNFKMKCHIGQKTLKELLWSGPLTLTSISQIDGQCNGLNSSLDIIQINKRVKTYSFKNEPTKRVRKPKKKVLDHKNDDKNDDHRNDMLNKETEISKEKEVKIDVNKDYIKENTFSNNDDRTSSDDEFRLQIVTDADDTDVEEVAPCDKLNVEEIKISHDVKENTIKEKGKKQKKPKINKAKVKKVAVSNTKTNYLDPQYWLKINLNEEEALEELRTKAKEPKYLSAAYKCSGCVKGFSKEDMLNRHIQLRHNESLGPIECGFCSMRFRLKSRLRTHIIQHYTKYKCLRCNIICLIKDTALSHNAFHNGFVRKCTHCGEVFRHSSSYYTHLRTLRSEHVCKVCGASFTSSIGLNIHKRIHITTVIDLEEDVSTYCERCDMRFETRNAYELHLAHSLMHAENSGNQATETPAPATPKQRKALKRSGRRNPRKPSTCSICNKTLPNYTAYMRHHAEEHKDKPLPKQRRTCEICGASVLANSVKNHLNTHAREKLYPCPTCGLKFNSKRTVIRHQLTGNLACHPNAQTIDKLFPCATCGMQFKTKGSMTRHQLTHTGEKPFKCSECDKRFTQLGSMRLHHRTIHLKEPYPKRKKTGVPPEAAVSEDRRTEDESGGKSVR